LNQVINKVKLNKITTKFLLSMKMKMTIKIKIVITIKILLKLTLKIENIHI